MALSHLLEAADDWLTQGPWSVTSKNITAPSGSKHDYASQSTYFWPSDGSPDGCPYEFRDGVINPETKAYTDLASSRKMIESSYVLALAWYYTGREAYGRHASYILQTWFLDPATRMTAHMNHAQITPCQNNGSFGGLIEFSESFTSVLDAAAILSDTHAPGWTAKNHCAFKTWNRKFLDWLVNSELGIEAHNATNNHGTFHRQLSAAIALFVGNTTIARQYVAEGMERIDIDIAKNGSQPNELWRTRPWHYSNFNLVALTRLADMGDKLGINLWNYTAPEGGSILKAIEYLIPAALNGEEAWPHGGIEFEAFAASDNIHAAADRGSRAAREALVSGRLETPPKGDLWVLRPAVEQLKAEGK